MGCKKGAEGDGHDEEKSLPEESRRPLPQTKAKGKKSSTCGDAEGSGLGKRELV